VTKATSEGFPHDARIVRSSDYRAIYRAGKKVYSESFVLFGRENGIGKARLGITVSRKIGDAVVRNRVKRLFREIFRRSLGEIPNNLDIVVNARPSSAEAKFQNLRAEFLDAAQKLCR
jgi:ribonuclease P protein component